MTQFIDLSIPITTRVISDPPVMLPQIEYVTHENTWAQIALFFPGLTREDLPDGEGWAVETMPPSTHNATHMALSFNHRCRRPPCPDDRRGAARPVLSPRREA